MECRLPSLALLVLLLGLAPALIQAEDAPVYDELPDERVLYVAPGQTLGGLVRKAYPERPELWSEIEQWIVEHNPHAFIGGDPARLRGDVRLQLPRASAFAERQTRSSPRQAGDFELAFDGRYLFVNPSQSLAELVPRIYPEQAGRWEAIIDAIVERNTEAVSTGDTSQMIARGTRLLIPNVVETTPEQVARRESGPKPQPVVGRVVEMSGVARATDSAGRGRRLEPGSLVRRGDTLSTSSGTTVRVEFRDGEQLTLRPDSRVRVRKWSLPEVGPGQRVIGLLAGGLRAITGALGNRDEDDYRTITPAATMGIRGTDYSVQLCEAGDCANSQGESLDDGVYVGVTSGQIELLNAGGEAVYGSGEHGYVAAADVAPAHIAANDAPAAVTVESGQSTEQVEADDGDEDGGKKWLIGIGILLLAL